MLTDKMTMFCGGGPLFYVTVLFCWAAMIGDRPRGCSGNHLLGIYQRTCCAVTYEIMIGLNNSNNYFFVGGVVHTLCPINAVPLCLAQLVPGW